MSNSSLVNYTRISPNRSAPRANKITHIVIHHMAGNLTVETCGGVFAPTSRGASSNYGIDSKGRVGMYVEEKDRSWCTSSRVIDNKAVTIEVADDQMGSPWHSSAAAMSKLVTLCADICRRNGIKKLNYTGNKNGNLHMHKWYSNTDCPGKYLESQFKWIADSVNKILNGGSYTPPSGNTTNTAKKFTLTVDGSFGPATVQRTQQFLGTYQDGVVSNQPQENKKYCTSCYKGCWEFKASGYSAGSSMVRAWQKMLGVTADGYCGPITIKALQKLLGTQQTGYMNATTVKAWQKYLNEH